MAKGIYLGVNGVKQSKKVYIGDNGVRKVKKIYGGINGVKLLYSADISYKGNAPNLDTYMFYHAGANTPNYALFAGGLQPNLGTGNAVIAYNKSLVKTYPASVLSVARSKLTGGEFQNKAIFACGVNSSGSFTADVDAYNDSLVRTIHTTNAVMGKPRCAKNSNYIFFGGGDNTSAIIKCLNSSLVSSEVYTDEPLHYMGAASINDYALYAGGVNGNNSLLILSKTYAYNSSRVKSYPTALSQARCNLQGASNSNFALFLGGTTFGNNSSDAVNTVDAYNSSLVRTIATPLTTARIFHTAFGVDDYVIVAAGTGTNNKDLTTIEVYDTSLVKTILDVLNPARSYTEIAKVGDYILIGGGRIEALTGTDKVDVLEI